MSELEAPTDLEVAPGESNNSLTPIYINEF